jgi:DNA polymerase (family X)
MDNTTLAARLDETADLLEIDGANSFRVRAYRNAARLVEDLPLPLAELVAAGTDRVQELPGIGKDLAEKLASLVTSGSFPQLEELRQKIPGGVREMLRISGLGPKKAAVLFRDLAIDSLAKLRAACEAGTVADLKGFGKKTQTALLEGLASLGSGEQRTLLSEARPIAEALAALLRTVPGVSQVEPAGSVRRGKETIGDLDLLCTASDPAPPMDALAAHPWVEKVLARGETKQRVRLTSGLELDLRVVPAESFGAALQYFTGSKEHNIVVRQRALERGYKLNEYGVYQGEELVAGTTEADVYAAVGLPWIAPELRENREEFQRAEHGTLPVLVEPGDLRGDLHMHTTATDGTASIEEMIEAAIARGREYIAITDHSKRVTIANGLDADRLRAHWREIERVRAKYPQIKVLKGIECDILEDATLDLSDDVLAEADWVIAVLHFGLKQTQAEIHARFLTAIRNPYVDIIGHPTARIVGKRPPVAANMDEILRAAADHGVLMEINASPSRLDLSDVLAAAARDLKIPLVISSDAHSTAGMDVLTWGVTQARRAACEAKDVASTLSWPEFRALLERKRPRGV